METNLVDVVDELILLHAGVSTALLAQFPKAYGVSYFIDQTPAKAIPTMDVPPGYADGYADKKFERKAEELLEAITPRVRELAESVEAYGIRLRDFSVKASRCARGGKRDDAAIVSGAISGSLGGAFIIREMLATKNAVLALEPAILRLTGIVEDVTKMPALKEASERGLRAVAETMLAQKTILNHVESTAPSFMTWFDHFPVADNACEHTFQHPVAKFTSESNHRPETLFATPQTVDRLGDSGGRVVLFDAERGFDLARPARTVASTHTI